VARPIRKILLNTRGMHENCMYIEIEADLPILVEAETSWVIDIHFDEIFIKAV